MSSQDHPTVGEWENGSTVTWLHTSSLHLWTPRHTDTLKHKKLRQTDGHRTVRREPLRVGFGEKARNGLMAGAGMSCKLMSETQKDRLKKMVNSNHAAMFSLASCDRELLCRPFQPLVGNPPASAYCILDCKSVKPHTGAMLSLPMFLHVL